MRLPTVRRSLASSACAIWLLASAAGNLRAAESKKHPPVVLALSVEDLPGSSPAPIASASTGSVQATPSAQSSDTVLPSSTGSAGAPSSRPNPSQTEASPEAREIEQPESPSPVMATPSPTPLPPALDVSTINTGPDLGTVSLVPEIKHAETPSLAASLRLTEQARQEFNNGNGDGALRELSQAVSLDPGNPWAFYYLGRVYLARKNYAQAETFFQRSELGFANRPDWLAEALTLEGTCDEELGRTEDAARTYQRAVAAAPTNLRAKLGYDRLSYTIAPAGALDTSAPGLNADLPPPSVAPPEPPPAEAPPPLDEPQPEDTSSRG